jgi:hypothetical protein
MGPLGWIRTPRTRSARPPGASHRVHYHFCALIPISADMWITLLGRMKHEITGVDRHGNLFMKSGIATKLWAERSRSGGSSPGKDKRVFLFSTAFRPGTYPNAYTLMRGDGWVHICRWEISREDLDVVRVILLILQGVLGRTNCLLSLNTTRATLKTTSPTILLLLCVYSLPR